MKLKLLQDLDKFRGTLELELMCGKYKQGFVPIYDLKKEAIKCIKDMRDCKENSKRFEDFFNITEEDLK